MTTAIAEEQDREAMAQLVAGHDAALNELMGRHAPRLYNYLLRVLQNESEASDLAQECFVRIYQHRHRYQPQKRFSTWLYTIATNLARDVQRRHARHPNVSLDDEQHETGQSFRELVPNPALTPGETLEAAERAQAVQSAVNALPEELRFPLILSHYEDKSHAEIGAVLNCSAKAIEMRLYRARQELRVRLARYCQI